MRTTADRIRHTILFELVSLAIVLPAGSWLFGIGLEQMGVIGVGSSIVATIWNYVYNLGFDHLMLRLTGRVAKSLPVRIAHALLFEAGLLLVLLPAIAWYLGISLMEAFIMDIAIAGFYVVYAFVFNLAYDRAFPLPVKTPAKEPAKELAKAPAFSDAMA
ncbi:PACE efflux transporter [Phreatobacter stygius]|uniref:PACE efflux transporter n=1 Tax=Phreatobacter stygius TaxID=1940610 RepID=A0A4D7BA04_9HYPH|nr:PACE efflux transporter [Phreatobacter stygius]QCI67543.1 PACE efflux transporter [Phreatobacter stygius]